MKCLFETISYKIDLSFTVLPNVKSTFATDWKSMRHFQGKGQQSSPKAADDRVQLTFQNGRYV